MGIIEWLTCGSSPAVKDAIKHISAMAFEITVSAVNPPKGEMDNEMKNFLPRLSEGRRRAVKFREDWKNEQERQFAAQGFPGMAAADPIDDILTGWFSIAIIFDYDKMDSSYGIQAFQALFNRVDPVQIQDTIIVHFGDLIQFDSFCSLALRSKSIVDLAYIAKQLGPDFDAAGLLPYSIRFLRAAKTDGHLIARTFSLPISAELRGNTVYPDAQAGVEWILDEAVKDTKWRKN